MKLLTLNHEGVVKLIESMESEAVAIKKNAYRIAWFSRGSVQYTDALNMSPEEIKIANELIESNMDVTKHSKMPFF